MKDGRISAKKGSLRHLFLFNVDTWEKMKEVIVYEHVSDKNLLWFHQIRLQIAETSPAKSGTVTGKPKIRKMRLKDSFDSPNWWHL
jgi:hypothetical protein